MAGAITDKGITTATDAAFVTMADNISQISTLATDTADATATAAQILSGAKAYVKGLPVVGTMPNNGGANAAISSGSLKAGYTSGGAIANLSAGNIKSGVSIGGIVGNLQENTKKLSLIAKGELEDRYYNGAYTFNGASLSMRIQTPIKAVYIEHFDEMKLCWAVGAFGSAEYTDTGMLNSTNTYESSRVGLSCSVSEDGLTFNVRGTSDNNRHENQFPPMNVYLYG